MLDWQKYMQLSHYYLNLVLLRLKLLLSNWEDINRQALIKVRQKWTKQDVIHYVLTLTYLLILFGISKNCHSSGSNLLLYLFIKRGSKTDCSNYRGMSLLPTTYNVLYSYLKVNSIRRQNYRRSSTWISTLWIKCWLAILYSLNTGENDSTMRQYVSYL